MLRCSKWRKVYHICGPQASFVDAPWLDMLRVWLLPMRGNLWDWLCVVGSVDKKKGRLKATLACLEDARLNCQASWPSMSLV